MTVKQMWRFIIYMCARVWGGALYSWCDKGHYVEC